MFLNPNYKEGVNEKYLPADEYLSGNVRQKWAIAKAKAEQDPQYQINADALAQVQPTDLTASEISVRLVRHGWTRRMCASLSLKRWGHPAARNGA